MVVARAEVLYVLVVLLSGAVNAVIARWLLRRSGNELSVRIFAVLLVLQTILGVLVVAELLVPTRSMAILVYNIHSAVIVVINVVWFLFALAYVNRTEYLSRPVTGLLAVYIGSTTVLMVTNGAHRLMWRSYTIATGPFPYVEATPTLLYVLLITVTMLFYIGGIGVLGYAVLFGPSGSRRQSLALLMGFKPPLVILVVWGLGALPGPLNGAFVIGSTVALALVAWAVFRYRLFGIVPLARERVFDELDEIVLVVDREYTLLDYNQSARETFPELVEATGRPLEDVFPDFVDDGEFVESLTRYEDDSMHEYAVDVSSLEVDGTVRGYALVARDVTERQQHVRTLEQQTAQLKQFASTLSHDLRNPLNVAHGWIELAIESGEQEPLERSQLALNRINQIIDDLLTLAQKGRTIDESRLRQVHLARVFEDAWVTVETHQATYTIELDNDIIYADAARLRNVFENVIRNAVEHGGENVAITVGRLDNGFYIEDDGPGVPAGQHGRVFDYEFTTDEEGTGLGLAIVEAIATAHGWDVTMSDGARGGARLSFTDVEMKQGIGTNVDAGL